MVGQHGAARFAVLMVVAATTLALSACSGSTASSAPSAAASVAAPSVEPTPTPTTAPSPSPTPLDVSAAFLKIITDPAFSGSATLTGTITVGATEGEMSGTYAGDADSSESSLTIKAGTFTQTTDKISTGGKDWTRVTPGPWLEDLPKTGSDRKLADTLKSIGAVEDAGVVSHGGKQLHHLKRKGGAALTADDVGFDIEGATDSEFGMEFYATDDGTPSSMVLTGSWTQGTGTTATKTSVDVEYVFTATGTPHTVEPPTDVWVRYTSKAHGYTMAHPADWTVKATKGEDEYSVDGQPYVYVGLTPYIGSTEAFAAALVKSYSKSIAGKPDSQTATRLDGQPAIRLTFQFKNDKGADVILVDDVISRKGTGWEVFVIAPGTSQDVAIFDQFVATFTFDK